MKRLGSLFRREARSSASPESPTVPLNAHNFMQFFGIQNGNLPVVTTESALSVTAVSAAVTFLSSSLANLPLHAFKAKGTATDRISGGVQSILNESPHADWTSFGWRKYMWQQVFTGGRGLSWIERKGKEILAIWPLDPSKVKIKRTNGQKVYEYDAGRGQKQVYSSADIIDIPFLLKTDQLSSYSPIVMGNSAIALALAMSDYTGNFFAGGGVPPLALSGPLPSGPDGMKRAIEDISRSIKHAKDSKTPLFQIPPGYDIKQVGYDPAKGQMTEARRFQIEEIARIYNLPPVFLQDLSRGTFANVEQQDLHLVKHLIAQWAKAFEEEINLKLFQRKNDGRYVEHNLDALMRGDFKSRIEGLARGVHSGLITPNEGRSLENRPAKENGDVLYIQGATVPLGSQAVTPIAPQKTEPDQTPPSENGGNDL